MRIAVCDDDAAFLQNTVQLIENGDASFLTGIVAAEDEAAWDNAVEFVDSLSEPAFDGASDADDEAPSALVDRAFEHGDLPPDGPDLAAIARAARFSSRGVI